ncbi:MAG TPA: TRL-like family protein [Candidatus Omnitrophota bacterium]|jgi:hypothetical protein|nr:TRL-like family protein [Candidatus Omnitrophota bacterium]HRZ15532.1 TRL-like family protein [Candidatus Omnitrophota bacterium]
MKKVLALLLVVLFLSGCATPLPVGCLYTEVGMPAAAGEGGHGSKVGIAKSTSILGLIATGDGSIKAAMAAGGITRIKYVDYNAKNILGLYGEYTTTVYGD